MSPQTSGQGARPASRASLMSMKVFLALFGVMCVVQGVGGVLGELLGGEWRSWFLLNHIGFLHGYQTFAGLATCVLGIALCAAAHAAGRD
jgi:hypothetical protein